MNFQIKKRVIKIYLVFLDTWKVATDTDVLLTASSLAYTTILAIVPLLAVSFSIFQSFGGLDNLYQTIEPFIIENLAQEAGSDAMRIIRKMIANIHAGALGAGGFVGLIVTSMSMLSSAEKAINRVWNTQPSRPLFYRLSSYWLFISLGPLAFAFALGSSKAQSLNFERILPEGGFGFILIVFFFYLIYQFVPSRKVHWKPAIGGALFTASFWYLAKIGYGVYTSTVLTYNKIYGSMAAIPILLLWIFILWVVILSGAAFSSAIQKRFDSL
ncbi:MAG: hypothetical protein CL678_10170 [Bdellovibrionaceae bacterium]|nr:hypothetical protein [Pseudobdellovibrionaceae bacterium]